MSRIIMLIPTGTSVGLTSVSLGVIRAMERKGVRLSVFKPIAQPRTGGDAPDQTTTIVRANSSTTTAAEPLKMSYVEGLLSSNQKDVLMEEIVANYHANTKDAEVVLVEGLVPTRKHQFAQSLNYEIAKTLNAEIVFVMSQGTDTPEQLKERIELTRNSFGGAKNTNITGVIVITLFCDCEDPLQFSSSKAIETLPDCICVLRSLELIVGKRTSASNPPGATNVHDLSIKFPVK